LTTSAPSPLPLLVKAADRLRTRVSDLAFTTPEVSHVYNPLAYAWELHRAYLQLAAPGRKQVLFLGMNPGPWGMAQTGVPFGEISAVRDWMGLRGSIARPPRENPQRPILGFDCPRSEVSGRRLWGTIAELFPQPGTFFQKHFVANFCPLVFMGESGRNITPDQIKATDRARLFAACQDHLEELVRILDPEWLIGIGGFAEKRLLPIAAATGKRCGSVLHPSPASPAANRGWARAFQSRMEQLLGVWPPQ